MKGETAPNYRLNNNIRYRIHQALKGKVKSSTVDTLGLDIDTYMVG